MALLLASAMVVTSLAGCGNSDSTSTSTSDSTSTESSASSSDTAASEPVVKKAEPIKDYYTYETANREMEAFNILYSQMANDLNVLTNCIDGLLSTMNTES